MKIVCVTIIHVKMALLRYLKSIDGLLHPEGSLSSIPISYLRSESFSFASGTPDKHMPLAFLGKCPMAVLFISTVTAYLLWVIRGSLEQTSSHCCFPHVLVSTHGSHACKGFFRTCTCMYQDMWKAAVGACLYGKKPLHARLPCVLFSHAPSHVVKIFHSVKIFVVLNFHG